MKLNSTYMLLISVALIGGCLHQAMAFSVGPAGRCRPSLSTPTSTCLFSEDEGAAGEQVPQEQETAQNNNNNSNDSSSTDILNSPAFLKRKVDVLKSDIAKVEEDIAAAKQRLEEGKAEWGGQLDDLQKEVSWLFPVGLVGGASILCNVELTHRYFPIVLIHCDSLNNSTKISSRA